MKDTAPTPEDIRSKYAYYGQTEKLNKGTAVHDIRLLLEEIDRLNDKARIMNNRFSPKTYIELYGEFNG